MGYSIGEVSKILSISAYTLRYYEKEGLISINRKENGLRDFSEEDIKLLKIIICLKETKMPIAHIKKYIEPSKGKVLTKDMLKKIFTIQKEHIEKEIKRLTQHLKLSKYKIWYYENINTLEDENDPHNNEQRNVHGQF